MKVINHGEIVEDSWIHVDDDDQLPSGGCVTVSLERLKSLSEAEAKLPSKLGVRIGPAQQVNELETHIPRLELVSLAMHPFTDGRSFTQARMLRERFGFKGEIRVTGDFLRDQMYYLQRLGVDSFEFEEGTDLNDRLKAFTEFTVTYQAAQDQPIPLYRRRHG